ncbi:MAG TPA: carboxypeptidase-like regulatory domain-containing protein, partial [Phycisphaerae bacterium]
MVEVGRLGSAPPGNSQQPVGNGTIRVQFEGNVTEADGRVRTVSVYRFNDVQQPVWRELPLSAESVAVFDRLPAGSYAINTRHHENPVHPRQAAELQDGQTVEVTLTKGPATLHGTVRAGGEPIADAYVRCEVLASAPPGTIEEFYGTTASDGEYEIEGLPPGDFQAWIQVSGSILQPFHVRIAPGENHFDADLPLGHIEGRVVVPPHPQTETL